MTETERIDYRDDWSETHARIERDARTAERARIRAAIEALPRYRRTGDSLMYVDSEGYWLNVLQVIEAIGTDLPEPTFADSDTASHVDGLTGRERTALSDEPPGVAVEVFGK